MVNMQDPFLNFIRSIKNEENSSLLESFTKGYKTIFENSDYNEESLKNKEDLLKLLPLFVNVAQEEYNQWNQDGSGIDEELGSGGICQEIAGAIAGVLSDNGIECSTVSAQVGEQHVWTICKLNDGVYSVDISPYTYETGGGYNWKKIPNVVFSVEDISIHRDTSDPSEFEDMIGDQ